MQQFSEIVNKSIKATFAFEIAARGFGFLQEVIMLVLFLAGTIIGLVSIPPSESGLFGVVVLYLVTVAIIHQWNMKQCTKIEGVIVSAKRIMLLQHLKQEK